MEFLPTTRRLLDGLDPEDPEVRVLLDQAQAEIARYSAAFASRTCLCGRLYSAPAYIGHYVAEGLVTKMTGKPWEIPPCCPRCYKTLRAHGVSS